MNGGCGARQFLHSHFMKSECGGINRVERVERGERLGRGEFLTTDYTDLHGWKRWDLFLSYFDGRVEHKEHKDSSG